LTSHRIYQYKVFVGGTQGAPLRLFFIVGSPILFLPIEARTQFLHDIAGIGSAPHHLIFLKLDFASKLKQPQPQHAVRMDCGGVSIFVVLIV
jgi:hypothetical protein